MQFGTEARAVLDATDGWYSFQSWKKILFRFHFNISQPSQAHHAKLYILEER